MTLPNEHVIGSGTLLGCECRLIGFIEGNVVHAGAAGLNGPVCSKVQASTLRETSCGLLLSAWMDSFQELVSCLFCTPGQEEPWVCLSIISRQLVGLIKAFNRLKVHSDKPVTKTDVAMFLLYYFSCGVASNASLTCSAA